MTGHTKGQLIIGAFGDCSRMHNHHYLLQIICDAPYCAGQAHIVNGATRGRPKGRLLYSLLSLYLLWNYSTVAFYALNL